MQTFLMPMPKMQFWGTTGTYTGLPLSGGKVYTAVAGTSPGPGQASPKTTWQDANGVTPNANPIVLDSQGMAQIWISGYYAIAVYDILGVLQYTQDNVFAGSPTPVAVVPKSANVVFTVSDINQTFDFNTTSNMSVQLPNPATCPSGSTIKVKNIGNYQLLITGINLDGTVQYLAPYDEVNCFTDGTNWYGKPLSSRTPGGVGCLNNGYISPTGGANLSLNIYSTNLLQFANGVGASAGQPVWAKIGTGFYNITIQTISVTGGANPFNAETGNEVKGQIIDLFLYGFMNANNNSIALGLSRYPGARMYSDLSSTVTNNKYVAVQGTAPSANDAATVLARSSWFYAGGNWSPAGLTPNYQTQEGTRSSQALTWTPVQTGWAATPSVSAQYSLRGEGQTKMFLFANIAGTSNLTNTTITLPFAPLRTVIVPIFIQDNGVFTLGAAYFTAANNILTLYPSGALGPWTSSGTKLIHLNCEIEI